MTTTAIPEFSFNWSFSKLLMWETCAYRFKLRYIDKLPEPPREPDNPLERGNRVHDRLEKYVKGQGPLDSEAKQIKLFEPALDHMAVLYSEGTATAEDNWFYNYNWDVCSRDEVWLWAKLDFLVLDEPNAHAIIGDYKTGKSGFKTIEHVQQLQLYAGITALRYDWVEEITPELWYLDEGWVRSASYTREDALRFVGQYERRVERLYADRLFKPNPSKPTCRYCPYGPRGTGACPVGV